MGHKLQSRTTEPGSADSLGEGKSGIGLGLDDLLRESVIKPSDAPNRLWADRILDSLLRGAGRGDFRTTHEVFRRIGAPPTSHREVETYSIDDATARKVLEAVRGPNKDRSVA